MLRRGGQNAFILLVVIKSGGHHIALTVTDADRSAEWYSGLLGLSVLPAGDDETVKYRQLADPESGWVLGVLKYHVREGDFR